MPRYTYVVSDRGEAQLPGGSMARIDGLLVEWSKELSCFPIAGADGDVVALLVGHAYDSVIRRFHDGPITLPEVVVDIAGLVAFIDSLAGAFFVVTSKRYGQAVYMDPGATLPLFWRTDDRIAGSSPEEIADRETLERHFDSELHYTCIVKEGFGSWIGGDLTAYTNIRKLLPNHRLDLGRSAERYWPLAHSWRDMETAIERASKDLLDFTAAAADRFDLKIALTAGYDTRLVLASSRNVAAEVEYFTLAAKGSGIDCWAAAELAAALEFRHRVLELVPSTREDMAMWDRRVGYSVCETNREQFRSVSALGSQAVVATGMYGEVGRCRLYRQNVDRINSMTITPEFVASRLTIPAPEPVCRSLAWWLEGLRAMPPSVIMDLAFLELKFGAWAMGQKPATSQAGFTISPMAQRSVLEAFVFVRPEEKRTHALFERLIAACWPEVMRQPVNKYGDLRDALIPLKKALNPMRVRRYIRDRLARS
jgi:hypothetical protein